jgi:SOS-response transcriptional repressor LexA
MRNVTDRQREVLSVILQFTQARGMAPTLREIMIELGIKSTNGVADHLNRLEHKGLIVRDAMLSRSIRITSKGGSMLGCRVDAIAGVLVHTGSAEFSDSEGGDHELVLSVTDQAYRLLDRLVATGLFGVTRTAVAEQLLNEKLRDVLIQHGKHLVATQEA